MCEFPTCATLVIQLIAFRALIATTAVIKFLDLAIDYTKVLPLPLLAHISPRLLVPFMSCFVGAFELFKGISIFMCCAALSDDTSPAAVYIHLPSPKIRRDDKEAVKGHWPM